MRGEEQENEAVQDRQLAMIHDRPEPVRRMGHEIGDRHFPRDEECDRACQNPNRDEGTADQLEHSRKPGQFRKRERHLLSARLGEPAQDFLRPVAPEEKPGDDSK